MPTSEWFIGHGYAVPLEGWLIRDDFRSQFSENLNDVTLNVVQLHCMTLIVGVLLGRVTGERVRIVPGINTVLARYAIVTRFVDVRQS